MSMNHSILVDHENHPSNNDSENGSQTSNGNQLLIGNDENNPSIIDYGNPLSSVSDHGNKPSVSDHGNKSSVSDHGNKLSTSSHRDIGSTTGNVDESDHYIQDVDESDHYIQDVDESDHYIQDVDEPDHYIQDVDEPDHYIQDVDEPDNHYIQDVDDVVLTTDTLLSTHHNVTYHSDTCHIDSVTGMTSQNPKLQRYYTARTVGQMMCWTSYVGIA